MHRTQAVNSAELLGLIPSFFLHRQQNAKQTNTAQTDAALTVLVVLYFVVFAWQGSFFFLAFFFLPPVSTNLCTILFRFVCLVHSLNYFVSSPFAPSPFSQALWQGFYEYREDCAGLSICPPHRPHRSTHRQQSRSSSASNDGSSNKSSGSISTQR